MLCEKELVDHFPPPTRRPRRHCNRKVLCFYVFFFLLMFSSSKAFVDVRTLNFFVPLKQTTY